MTLTTRIAIIEPTPVRPVFDECRRLLDGEDVPFMHGPSSHRTGVAEYRNAPGQGLHALLWVSYGADAPMAPDPRYADDPDERRYYPPVSTWSVEVAFDTAYGYHSDRGGSCSDLHARLILQLGRWLSERGLTWYWYDEFRGEWHASSIPVQVLGDPTLGALREELSAH
jgi:hypothetical protein